MTTYDLIKLVLAILTSLGGGGAIVLAFSGWLGKLWSARILEAERAKHGQELEGIKARYSQDLEGVRSRFSHELEGLRANHSHQLEELKTRFLLDTERHRTALKKSEFIFQKEYEAASAFVAILRSVRPTSARPDMDWHDACDEIARNFEAHEQALEALITKHGAVIEEEVRNRIGTCIGIASDAKFLEAGSSYANQAADQFYKNLVEVERALLHAVHSQAMR